MSNRFECVACGQKWADCDCNSDVEENGIGIDGDISVIEGIDEDEYYDDGDDIIDDFYDESHYDEEHDSMTDAEADADTLRSAGWGTDEDYGMYDHDDRDFGMDDY